MILAERLLLYPAGLVLAAIVSILVAWSLVVGLTVLGSPSWFADAGAALLAAAAFVYVGAQVAASRGLPFPLLLFTVGACISWFLFRGIVRDISPYHGILELVCSYVGGGGGILLCLKQARRVSRVSLAASAFVVAAAIFLVSAEAAFRPQYGNLGYVYGPTGAVQPIRFVWLDGYASAAIWSPSENVDWLTYAAESGLIDLETYPGSGPVRATATYVHDPAELRRIRGIAEASMADRIRWERDHGFAPPFLTFSYRAARLPPGSVLRAGM